VELLGEQGVGSAGAAQEPENLEAVVKEVVAEAHLQMEELRPEEQAYLKDHALKKPLRVLDIWALGVGVVITGAYFGWNTGLKDNGPMAMLVASLVVCLLYLTWVLALAELSVAMPFAGGPLAYGRRAADNSLGFVMGWSMFLECQFAMVATALATGGYLAFLMDPNNPSPMVELWGGLGTVVVFFLLHAWGVREQSRAMMIMTYGAILGLIIFWIAAAGSFSWDRIWTRPVLPAEKGWSAVLEAVPYALWWLVIIETVALAAEEAHEPHRTIPRGLVWAQLTLVGLVVLTWLFACGAVDSQKLAVTDKGEDISYPLAEAIRLTAAGRSPALVYGFGTIALFGMIASYHGMVYGTSRQAFALGRAGYLPVFLGKVHAVRRTPVPALLVCSLVTAGFVVANLWMKQAIAVAVLVSTLTALIWYILAMGCLFVLRRREQQLFSKYRAPLLRILPITVVLLSAFAVCMYSIINVKVIPLTALLYAVGLGYYWFSGYRRIQKAAPEELAARAILVAETRDGRADNNEGMPSPGRSRRKERRRPWLDALTAISLLSVLGAVGWMVLGAWLPAWLWQPAFDVEILVIVILLACALILVSVVALLHTARDELH
jgi:ethanolamine permease